MTSKTKKAKANAYPMRTIQPARASMSANSSKPLDLSAQKKAKIKEISLKNFKNN